MPKKQSAGRPAEPVKRNTLGAKIAAARGKAGLSQEDLAQRVGYDQCSVSAWERNTRRPPREAIRTLAELLGLSIEELL